MKTENLIWIGGLIALIGFLGFSEPGKSIMTTVTGSLRRGERINNPGNIRKGAAWQGLSADQSADTAFAVFDSPFYGLRAMAKLLINYYGSGLNTITKIISKYAPATENATANYINTVSRLSGIAPTQVFALTPANLFAIMKAMINVEQGRVIYSTDEINKAISAVL